jgi:hypothetical protein
MTLRPTLALLALLLLSGSAQASSKRPHPFRWAKRHPTATAFLVAGGAATIHRFGLAHCAQGNVERCQAGYGARWQSFTAVTVTNFAVVSAAHSCWKNDGGKFCNVLGYGGSAAQAGFGIDQWRKRSAKTDSH